MQLRAGGAALGQPSTTAGGGAAAFRLGPTVKAQALVHGPSTCQAGVSDTMRITMPGLGSYTDAAVPMRGCPLLVDAFTASTG